MTKKEEAEEKRRIRREKEEERVAGMRAFEQEAAAEKLGLPWNVLNSGAENSSALPEPWKLFLHGAVLQKADGNMVLVCGIDEAGRGPLAGPVAAGVCILPLDHNILGLNDSKKLSPKKREELYEVITREAIAWKVCMVGPERIDEINILQADYEAMREAVAGLCVNADAALSSDPVDGSPGREHSSEWKKGDLIRPDILVNDAVTIPGIDIPQAGIIKADAKCLSVSAASILAKVTRDRYMEKMDRKYPEYGFARNKGYGTKEHIEALKKYGPCPLHRKTFIGHFVRVFTSGAEDWTD